MNFIPDNINYQTPAPVCNYMVNLIASQKQDITVLEPTPGNFNLVNAIVRAGYQCIFPRKNHDFWLANCNLKNNARYDYILMNPPFNPIADLIRFVCRATELSDNVIMLLPWNYIINSENRLKSLKSFGIVSITNLPRITFPNARVQTCIIQLKKEYIGVTEFKTFSFNCSK